MDLNPIKGIFVEISPLAVISKSSQIWSQTQIRENAIIGSNSIIGRNVYIDANVKIGQNCKIQNNSQLFDPTVIHDGVFIGPGVILTNDKNPRAIKISGELKKTTDWHKIGVEIFEGASLGAGVICIAPITIGKWSLIGAGSVVTKSVPQFAVYVGIAARQVGWVSKSGVKLELVSSGVYRCPVSLKNYFLNDGQMMEEESK
jgi:acetyltransferase-like isoleucine patch superfamily enzyme